MGSVVAIKLLMDFLIIAVFYTRKLYVMLSIMIYGSIQNATSVVTDRRFLEY